MASRTFNTFALLSFLALAAPAGALAEEPLRVSFPEKGSFSLGDQGKRALDGLYQRLAADPAAKLSIYGYTDASGERDLNQNVSGARAGQAKAYLLKLGLAPERILTAEGKGPDAPVADNATEEGRQKNRRVELLLSTAAPETVAAVPTTAPTPVPAQAAPLVTPAPTFQPTTVAEAPVTTAPVSPAPASQPADSLSRFALGVGYPDLRARVALGLGLDAEAKFAFAEGIQIYSGRLYWNFVDFGPLKVMAGAEGGYARFDGVETISGTGALAGGFVGAEYQFSRRLRLSLDAGPAWLQGSSEGQTFATTELIYNTALYLYIF